jgi:hypothetical protein
VILSEAEQEVARLKKELRDTQIECDILKRLSASSPGTLANIQVHKRP